MNSLNLILILALPLVSFLISGLLGRTKVAFGGILGTASLLGSLFLSLNVAYEYFMVYGKVNGIYTSTVPVQMEWLRMTDHLSINLGILVDPISVMMLVVVTLISFMVHLYSLGYMKGEGRFNTYYAFLSLFTFSMLGLVMASNIFQTYIFWELVGVSSYLLIGYYFEKPSAVRAAKKAFIVTRFADFGFLIGILVLSYYGQSLDIPVLTSRLTDISSSELIHATSAGFMGISALTWGLLLVFMGGAGKSAMFPLHIWLPDAMEGPTPVSALIHAATMVVAGVYLVARLFPLYAISCPAALEVVTYVGIFSAAFAALIACTQTDIKRVLAYSTMSQIGFMMFSLGVARFGSEEGFTASMFHLFTHAIFKALLFLCAGTVIHYIHSNEMNDMGGLRKSLPLSHISFLIACLAISGIPPFAGFFSKEEILHAVYHASPVLYSVALITAGFTAFYMFRLFYSIFYRKEQKKEHHHDHEHHPAEGSWVMKFPLVLLSVGTLIAGFLPFGAFVSANGNPMHTELDWSFSLLPIGVSVGGILLATVFFYRDKGRAESIAFTLGGFYRAFKSKFYIDEIYLFITRKIIFRLLGAPAAWIDRNIVDGMYFTLGRVTEVFSSSIAGFQSGKLQDYAMWFLGGVIGVILLFHYLLNQFFTVL